MSPHQSSPPAENCVKGDHGAVPKMVKSSDRDTDKEINVEKKRCSNRGRLAAPREDFCKGAGDTSLALQNNNNKEFWRGKTDHRYEEILCLAKYLLLAARHGNVNLIPRTCVKTKQKEARAAAGVYNPSARKPEPGGHWGSIVNQFSLLG